MAKDDGQSSQLNLTVVALVALVAIVGLVALVLNTASLAKISTGSQVVSAQSTGSVVIPQELLGIEDENLVGDNRRMGCYQTSGGSIEFHGSCYFGMCFGDWGPCDD